MPAQASHRSAYLGAQSRLLNRRPIATGFTRRVSRQRCPDPSLPARRRRVDRASTVCVHYPIIAMRQPLMAAVPYGATGMGWRGWGKRQGLNRRR